MECSFPPGYFGVLMVPGLEKCVCSCGDVPDAAHDASSIRLNGEGDAEDCAAHWLAFRNDDFQFAFQNRLTRSWLGAHIGHSGDYVVTEIDLKDYDAVRPFERPHFGSSPPVYVTWKIDFDRVGAERSEDGSNQFKSFGIHSTLEAPGSPFYLWAEDNALLLYGNRNRRVYNPRELFSFCYTPTPCNSSMLVRYSQNTPIIEYLTERPEPCLVRTGLDWASSSLVEYPGGILCAASRGVDGNDGTYIVAMKNPRKIYFKAVDGASLWSTLETAGIEEPVVSMTDSPAGVFLILENQKLIRCSKDLIGTYEYPVSDRKPRQVLCTQFSGQQARCYVLFLDSTVAAWTPSEGHGEDWNSTGKRIEIAPPADDAIVQIAYTQSSLIALSSLNRLYQVPLGDGSQPSPPWQRITITDGGAVREDWGFYAITGTKDGLVLELTRDRIAIGTFIGTQLAIQIRDIPTELPILGGLDKIEQRFFLGFLPVILGPILLIGGPILAFTIPIALAYMSRKKWSHMPPPPQPLPPPAPRPARRKALLVRYDAGNGNFIQAWRERLIKDFHFDFDDIEMHFFSQEPSFKKSRRVPFVVGNGAKAPTTKNFKATLDQWAQDSGPGDVRFIFIDGHGVTKNLTPGYDPNEPGSYDESIVLAKENDSWFGPAYVPATISDNDLADQFAKINPACNLTIMTLTCMGGGILDPHRGAHGILYSAVHETQLNYTYYFNGTWWDNTTSAMFEVLDKRKSAGKPLPTYREMFDEALVLLKQCHLEGPYMHGPSPDPAHPIAASNATPEGFPLVVDGMLETSSYQDFQMVYSPTYINPDQKVFLQPF